MILRQYKVGLKARFMELKSVKQKLRQDQIAKELDWSSSTIKQYRKDLIMLSTYRIPPKSHQRRQKTSIEDLNRLQIISNDLK